MTDFTATRALFDLPEGVIYLDGNSLGPLPRAAAARVARTVQAEWGGLLIRGWNEAGWMDWPARLGDAIGRLLGAPAGSVVLGDTLSVKVWQALAAALQLRPERKVILSDSGNFPSDLYITEGVIRALGRGHELRVVAPEAVEAAITPEVAALMVTEVDYRTGRRHDMPRLTARAHEVGALALWDLAHSAGAVPVDLSAGAADFAMGCTYKFLNGGPGAPAFIYIRPALQPLVTPVLSGWLGHDAPFAFEPAYRPGAGIERMRIGTPPVLQMAALEAALDIWQGVDMAALRARSLELGELFADLVRAGCPELELASPQRPEDRGSQISFRHLQGFAIMQALIAQGVIGDFRAPDVLRFGITPLYIGEAEIRAAADTLRTIMAGRLWDRPEYHRRARVT